MMRILIIGGTRFIGPQVCKQLLASGHRVTVFHRGQTNVDPSLEIAQIHRNRHDLSNLSTQLRKLSPDVVLDMICYNEREAADLTQVFSGFARRVVVVSSMDVYRAYGGLLGLEQAPVEQAPLDEHSALRESRFPYRAQAKSPDDMAFDYEKILVEQVVMNAPGLPGTILRLPAVYGPGDHRMFEYLKRMLDGRRGILLAKQHAGWRWTRGYVDNVAAAIVLAVTDDRAAGRIYNVGESNALNELEWVRSIGRAAGWGGDAVVLSEESMPRHLKAPYNFAHNLEASTNLIRRELGYKELISREDAFKRTVEWECANPPELFDPTRFDYEAEDAALAQSARFST